MKKLTFILVIAVLLAGGAVTTISTPSHAQGYEYATPPPDPYANPWVGPNTPWVYYNGDWFLNGLLYYFFGPQYGWGPYYAYPPTYIVRAPEWYAPRWQTWYRGHPTYWQHFTRAYPYWRGHRQGQRYNERFYEEHHRGQGGGWQRGFHGAGPGPTHPEGRGPAPGQFGPPGRPGPAQVAPSERQHPGPAGVTQPERQMPRPTHVAPTEGQRTVPSRVVPTEGQRPTGPTHVAPPAGQRQGPAQVAPPAGQRPAPASAPKAAPKAAPAPEKAAPGASQPEKGGHGEEKR